MQIKCQPFLLSSRLYLLKPSNAVRWEWVEAHRPFTTNSFRVAYGSHRRSPVPSRASSAGGPEAAQGLPGQTRLAPEDPVLHQDVGAQDALLERKTKKRGHDKKKDKENVKKGNHFYTRHLPGGQEVPETPVEQSHSGCTAQATSLPEANRENKQKWMSSCLSLHLHFSQARQIQVIQIPRGGLLFSFATALSLEKNERGINDVFNMVYMCMSSFVKSYHSRMKGSRLRLHLPFLTYGGHGSQHQKIKLN